MEKIRWGIIGCGNVTEVKSGPAFNNVEQSELIAVMRRDAAKAKDYAERHHVPKWYNEAHRLINDPDINAVYVATPPSSHEEYAIAAMEAGKMVYLEKPMSVDAASASRIAEAAQKYNTKICIAHYRRHLPIFVAIMDLLAKNIIGNVRCVNLRYLQAFDAPGFAPAPDNWRLDKKISGGGIFHDLSPHQLDIMYYFFGSPEQVKGLSFNQAGYYEADDVVAGIVMFSEGIVFNGLWNFVVTPSESLDRCEIIGSKGSLKFSIFQMDKLEVFANGIQEKMKFDVPAHVQQPMIAQVVQYFLGNRNNPCSADDGVTVMRMIDDMTSR